MTFADRLKEAMRKAGFQPVGGQSEFARQLGLKPAAVNQWLNAGRVPTYENLTKVAQILGANAYWLYSGEDPPTKTVERVRTVRSPLEIPVVGYVSAGDEFEPFDDLPKGHEFVTADFGESPVAVEVRGDSMLEVYRAGDRLMGPRFEGAEIASHCVNRDCFVKTISGQGFIKKVVRGSKASLFTLRSYNKDYREYTNVGLEWAAPVRWVRRVGV